MLEYTIVPKKHCDHLDKHEHCGKNSCDLKGPSVCGRLNNPNGIGYTTAVFAN